MQKYKDAEEKSKERASQSRGLESYGPRVQDHFGKPAGLWKL